MIWGFVMQLSGTEIAKNHPVGCTLTCATCASIAFVLSLFVKEDLKKLEYSRQELMDEDVAERLSKLDMLSKVESEGGSVQGPEFEFH